MFERGWERESLRKQGEKENVSESQEGYWNEIGEGDNERERESVCQFVFLRAMEGEDSKHRDVAMRRDRRREKV